MNAAGYPIRAVARITGLSVDTLRAWERRHGVVTPLRDARGRAYTDDDVARLKRLASLVEQGHAIGRIATLPTASLEKLLKRSPSSGQRDGRDERIGELLDAVRRYDVAAAETGLNRQAALLPPEALVFSVALPALRIVGEQWEAGAIRPSHEHMLSAVVRSVLGGLLRTMPRGKRASTIVIAAAAGERHELGLLCAAVLTASAGLQVLYLGPDLPAADILHATSHAKARAVLLAATVQGAVNTADWRALRRLPNSVDLWVGGPHASEARHAVGTRGNVVQRLEDLAATFQRYA